MTALREGLPPLPDCLAHLAIEERGYPVPWFVAWVDGVPDFRCMDSEKLVKAVKHDLCWTCGRPNGAYKVVAIGPMCVVNRVTAEPPSHFTCLDFAARACPWLTEPKRKRRERDMPNGVVESVGEMIRRNPGVTCLWSTKKVKPFRVDHGLMFQLGDPERIVWLCRGRTATREEILESIESGMPLLREATNLDADPAASMRDLERMYTAAMRHLPAV